MLSRSSPAFGGARKTIQLVRPHSRQMTGLSSRKKFVLTWCKKCCLSVRAGTLSRLQQPKVSGRCLETHDLISRWAEAITKVPVPFGVRVRTDTHLCRAQLRSRDSWHKASFCSILAPRSLGAALGFTFSPHSTWGCCPRRTSKGAYPKAPNPEPPKIQPVDPTASNSEPPFN